MIGLLKKHFKNGETITCMKPTICKDTKCLITLEVARVEEWYDCVFTVAMEGNIKDGMLFFEFLLDNKFKEGLYYFLSIIVCNENDEIVLKVDRLKEEKSFFIVNSKELLSRNLSDIYEEIVTKREEVFYSPVSNLNYPGDLIFEAILFCKNLYVQNNVTYGQVEIIPYKNLSYKSEIDYINEFFKKFETFIRINENNLSILESHDRPSAVIHIPTIETNSVENAGVIALEMASKLVNLYTLFRKSHGEIWGICIIDRITYKKYFKFIGMGYKGNLFEGVMAGEDCNQIRNAFYRLMGNYANHNIYLNLLNEAIKENDRLMKYYRLWNILESLGRDKGLLGQKRFDWNNRKIKEQGKHARIESAKQLVFELLRANISSIKTEEELLKDIDGLNRISQLLNICYQRRNCCVHQGKCLKNDATVCRIEDRKCKLCRQFMDDNCHGDMLEDKILLTLEEITFSIVKLDLKIDSDSNLIEIRQHVNSSKFVEI